MAWQPEDGDAGSGRLNRLVGWSCAASGVAVGLVLGLWSFDGPMETPAWIGAYDSTPRRLIRLGHIACIALGVLNVLLGRELQTLQLPLGARRLASISMNLGNVFLPLCLFLAAAMPPAKYLMSLPACCVFLALLLAGYGSRAGQAP